METTLIFVSYNNYLILKECLESAMKYGILSKNIIVADNGSTDKSEELIPEQFPGVKFLNLGSNFGYGGAVNRAIKEVNTKFVCVLNTDMVFLSNPFPYIELFFYDNKNVGVVGIQQVYPNISWQSSYGNFVGIKQILFDLLYITFLKRFITKQLFCFNWTFVKKVEYIDGAFMVFETQTLVSLNGFDEENFFFYYEDTDIAYRLKQDGYNNYFIPELNIIHYRGYSSTQNFSDPSEFSLNQFSIGLINYLNKHYSLLYKRCYIFLLKVHCKKQLLFSFLLGFLLGKEKILFKQKRYETILEYVDKMNK
ncbi:glycosyltransferase [Labilibaculum sp. A4]|uniref:glycosyltransferase family 2 protein n=1 Tax=Labilibaculum euxinus TaxID=2686357 RepID=UPI000F617E3B|nr:glycosyltransferase family 2 protein [Labilibaculum euxinus]MDQ1772720.1 glycosyltransferase family 2 protein [Labilibaculum euxinus]MWN78322.1 glycosyltransferase [Labilibaculum euxinus]